MQYWYFEIIDLVRKLLFTAVLVTFVNSSTTACMLLWINLYQAWRCPGSGGCSAFALSFAAVVVHATCQPFVSRTLDQMKMLSLLVICITQYAGIMLAIKDASGELADPQNVLVNSQLALTCRCA